MSQYMQMVVAMAGGLGLFLYGMKLMSDGLESVAGKRLRGLLEALTRTRLLGVIVGALFTMVIQSSSATTVMVVSFVNAGLMNLIQATGVIMGANFGTSITAQIAAFDLSVAAPLLLFAGVVMIMFIKVPIVQRLGIVVAGFGMLFVGMDMMSDAMKPLRTDAGFVNLMHTLASNPISALLVGIVITSILQSSSASIVLVQLLASEGLVTLDMALYICLGCAIGTCITAMLASLGTSRTARRAAVIHLLYNVFGSTLMVILLQFVPLADFLRNTSGDNVMRQIANGMMIMKITEIIIFFPLAKQLVALSMKLVPGEDEEPEKLSALYLDDLLLATPPIAVAQVTKEVERMGEIAAANLNRALHAFIEKDKSAVQKVMQEEKLIDFLNEAITTYLIKLGQGDLSLADSTLVGSLYHVINDLERVGDHAVNIAEYAMTRIEEDQPFSEQALSELRDMQALVSELLEQSMEIFHSRERSRLNHILEMEEHIDDEEQRLQQTHVDRLSSGTCMPQAGMIFSDLLNNMERVADHATNIAFSITADQQHNDIKTA